MIVVLHV